jgi:enoyl-CoA hydratase
MWADVPRLIGLAEADPDVKVVIIRGIDNSAFASGVDIDEFTGLIGSEEGAWALMHGVQSAEEAISRCSKPVIAMIQGVCVGGGVEIALACDLRFSSENATFAVPPAKLGLVYSLSSTKRLVDLVGPGLARDLLFSARSFGASEAREMGLVERVFDDAAIESETLSYARLLCRRSQFSIVAGKKTVAAALQGETAPGEELQKLRIGAFFGADLHEGIKAFHQKRAANFAWKVGVAE